MESDIEIRENLFYFQLLDFEFTFIGAAAQNVAHPITAYLFCYNNEDSTQKSTPEKLKFQADSVQAVRNMCKNKDICFFLSTTIMTKGS